jgi:hypothetical protein
LENNNSNGVISNFTFDEYVQVVEGKNLDEIRQGFLTKSLSEIYSLLSVINHKYITEKGFYINPPALREAKKPYYTSLVPELRFKLEVIRGGKEESK